MTQGMPKIAEHLKPYASQRYAKKKKVVASKLPLPPSWLSDIAKKEYNQLKKELATTLLPIDSNALALYCQCWAEFQLCTIALETEGRFINGKSHQACKRQLDLFTKVDNLGRAIGLSPNARMKLDTPIEQIDLSKGLNAIKDTLQTG